MRETFGNKGRKPMGILLLLIAGIAVVTVGWIRHVNKRSLF